MKHQDTKTNRVFRRNLKSHQKLERMGISPASDLTPSDPSDHYVFKGHRSNFKNARCNICNSVSSGEIESDYGSMQRVAFYKDPHNHGYLCGECFSSYADQMTQFDIEDEIAEKEGNPRRLKSSDKPMQEMSKKELRELLVYLGVDASVPISEAREKYGLDEQAQRDIEGRN